MSESDTPIPLSVALTNNFYAWEQRGRGWQQFDYPVQLEPSFVPFLGHYVPREHPITDDGRQPTLLSRLSEKVVSVFKEEKPTKSDIDDTFDFGDVIQPAFDVPDECYKEFQIVLPDDFSLTPEIMHRLLGNLAYSKYPLSFEVIGNYEKIVIQLCAYESDAGALTEQLSAYLPEIDLLESDGYLTELWQVDKPQTIIDFGLEHECMLPLQSSATYKVDPLIGITAALSNLNRNEVGLLQVLFQQVHNDWATEFIEAVTDWDGSAFFADAPQILPLTKEKIATPLYTAAVRVAAQSQSEQRAWSIAKNLSGTLTQFSAPPSNALMPLTNSGFDSVPFSQRIVTRESYRTGMFLNSAELVSLVHAPDASVKTQKVQRTEKRTKTAPHLATTGNLFLGRNSHRNTTINVSLTPEQRLRHMYLIGASGTGKSTMMLNMIIQDMVMGNGIAVLDPHGDLIDTVLRHVPDERVEDVIIFDPSDGLYPIGFNIIDAHSELEKVLLASDLTSVFKRLSTSWGDQMNSVLANGIAAMLESERGGTLPTLRRFLVDKAYRQEHLATVSDPENVFYWEHEFPLLSGKPQGPVLTRLDTFLRPKPIRYMVAQHQNKIDFAKIMQGKKIFLAKLSQGAIGTENSYLMGAFLVTKLNQIAFSRQELSEQRRNDFFLYIDEFHNFITPSMESILSGARKYKMGLILAHQELRQLESKNTDVASSVISNPYTRVCFRLGDMDAKRLQSGFSFFDAQDLQSLGIGEAIARVERAEYDFNLATLQLKDVDQKHAEDKARAIIKYSQQKYGTPREKVETLIYESIGAGNNSAFRPKKAPAQETKELNREPLPGRGGAEHKRLQQYVKKLGEKHGFKATIEKRIGDGTGHVDVALERDGLSFACEIAVNSTAVQEFKNIKKCLDAGFDEVLCVSSDNKFLAKLLDAEKEASFKEGAQYHLLPLNQIESFFSKRSKYEYRINGYFVEVHHKQINARQLKQKQQSVSKLLPIRSSAPNN